MTRHAQEPGARGSLKWIQEFVNHRSDSLNAAIHQASGGRIRSPITWVSPLAEDEFAEYRDAAFLERLGVSLDTRPLDDFWPRLGPQWDALGRDASGAALQVLHGALDLSGSSLPDQVVEVFLEVGA